MSITNQPICNGKEVSSSFQERPCYRYIRNADNLPTYDGLSGTYEEIVCRVKLFNPSGAGTWWIAAYDPDTCVAWGVAELFEREVGDFSMVELGELRGRFGLPIERDLYYKPKTVAELLT